MYDAAGGLLVLLDDGQQKYVWGAAGLAYSVDSAGALTVYHADGLGSVRALTDTTGQVVQTYQTDEFGVPVAAGTQCRAVCAAGSTVIRGWRATSAQTLSRMRSSSSRACRPAAFPPDSGD